VSDRLNKGVYYLLIVVVLTILATIPHSQANGDIKVPQSADEFVKWLEQKKIPLYIEPDIKLKEGNKGFNILYADWSIYKRYHEIVYGALSAPNASDAPGAYEAAKLASGSEEPVYSEETKAYEYRYLGYNKIGAKVANNKFEPSAYSAGSARYWTYTEGVSEGVWGDLTEDLQAYLYREQEMTNPTWDINEGDGFTPYDLWKLALESDSTPTTAKYAYTELQTMPSWFSDGSIRVWRIGKNNQPYYATFITKGFGAGTKIKVSIESVEGAEKLGNSGDWKVILPADQEAITLRVTYQATIEFQGQANVTHLSSFNMYRGSGSHILGQDTNRDGEITYTETIRVARDDYLSGGTIPLTMEADLMTIWNEGQNGSVSKKLYVEVIPEDPTLTLTVHASKNTVDYNKVDIPVDITAQARVYNVSEEKIERIVLNFENKEETNQKAVVNTGTWAKKISTAEMAGVKTQLIKKWVVKAKAYLRDGTVLECLEEDTTLVYVQDEEDPEGESYPPEVKIKGPKQVLAYDKQTYKVRTSSPVGSAIIRYDWDCDDALPGDIGNTKSGEIYWTDIGSKRIKAKAKDSKGLWGNNYMDVEVLPPAIETSIFYEGMLKENRIIHIRADSQTPSETPIILSKRLWQVNSFDVPLQVSGYGNGVEAWQFSPGRPGRVTVGVTDVSTIGYTDNDQVSLTIVKDQDPKASVYVTPYMYRNPEDNLYATVNYTNTSSSPDGDELGRTIMEYRYDSDCDGNYDDEVFKCLIDTGGYVKEGSFRVGGVGNYQVRITQYESFEVVDGLNSREQFLSSVGYAIFTVDNMAPNVGLYADKAKTVDMHFDLGEYRGMSEASLKGYIQNSLTPFLKNNGYELNATVSTTVNTEIVDSSTMNADIFGKSDFRIWGGINGRDAWKVPPNEKGGWLAWPHYFFFESGIEGTNITFTAYLKAINLISGDEVSLFEWQGIDLQDENSQYMHYDGYPYHIIGEYNGRRRVKFRFYTMENLSLEKEFTTEFLTLEDYFTIDSYDPRSGLLLVESKNYVYVVNGHTGRLIHTYHARRYHYKPVLSSDGKKLAWYDGFSSWYCVDIATSKMEKITNNDQDKPPFTVYTPPDPYSKFPANRLTSQSSVEMMNIFPYIGDYLSRDFQYYGGELHFINRISGSDILIQGQALNGGGVGYKYYAIEKDNPDNISWFYKPMVYSALNDNHFILLFLEEALNVRNGSGDYFLKCLKFTTKMVLNDRVKTIETPYYVRLDNSHDGAIAVPSYRDEFVSTIVTRDQTFINVRDHSNSNVFYEQIASDTGGMTTDLEALSTSILEMLKDKDSEEAPMFDNGRIIVTTEDPVSLHYVYEDYEQDPVYQAKLTMHHTNPDYFDNGLGNAGTFSVTDKDS